MILILTPSFLTFFQVSLRCLTSINFSSWLQLTTYAAVVWIYCFFEDIKQFLDLYSKWVKSTLNIYWRSSSSINDRCFCLTVHKSTLVVNEASMERLLNLLPSFYLGYTSHYWILWKKNRLTFTYSKPDWIFEAFKILHVQIRKIFINSLACFRLCIFCLENTVPKDENSLLVIEHKCWKSLLASSVNRHFQDFQHFWDFLCQKFDRKSSTALEQKRLEQILRSKMWEVKEVLKEEQKCSLLASFAVIVTQL